VRHTLSIAVPPNLLPTLIPRRFRESLDTHDSHCLRIVS